MVNRFILWSGFFILLRIDFLLLHFKTTHNTLKFKKMKFFIDTANLEQIKEAQALGVLDGVTTNPSLMAKKVLQVKIIF